MVGLRLNISTFQRVDYVALYAGLLLIDVVHYCGKDGWFYLSHLGGAIFLADEFVESAKAASEG